ncbi:sigma-70 family RNA polymerase sigma factor [Rubritalea tangerina]
MIRGYIRTLIPNASDVPDVLQVTNLVLWERREEFESGSNFKAWAFTIARYRAMNHRKKQLRSKELVLDDKVIDVLETSLPEESSFQVERQQVALEQCLERLRDKDRELIQYRYSAETSVEEYSRKVGRSSASLRVTLNRLRDALRQCMKTRLEGGTV